MFYFIILLGFIMSDSELRNERLFNVLIYCCQTVCCNNFNDIECDHANLIVAATVPFALRSIDLSDKVTFLMVFGRSPKRNKSLFKTNTMYAMKINKSKSIWIVFIWRKLCILHGLFTCFVRNFDCLLLFFVWFNKHIKWVVHCTKFKSLYCYYRVHHYLVVLQPMTSMALHQQQSSLVYCDALLYFCFSSTLLPVRRR